MAASFSSVLPISAAAEQSSSAQLAMTRRIARRSIYTFLQQYQYFTTFAAPIALPFSLSWLLAQAWLLPPPAPAPALLPAVDARLRSLFDAAGFPPSSEIFAALRLSLQQSISCSIITLPLALSSFLLAKATVIRALRRRHNQPPAEPISACLSPPNYAPLLRTYIANSFLMLSANATGLAVLVMAFVLIRESGLSSFTRASAVVSTAGAVLYSVIRANAVVICDLALVVSGMEKRGGCPAILEACGTVGGRASMALLLALPANLGMAAIEALFRHRIARPYRESGSEASAAMVLEGLLIAYLHCLLVVLDTVVASMFFRSCKMMGSGDLKTAGEDDDGGFSGFKDFGRLLTNSSV